MQFNHIGGDLQGFCYGGGLQTNTLAMGRGGLGKRTGGARAAARGARTRARATTTAIVTISGALLVKPNIPVAAKAAAIQTVISEFVKGSFSVTAISKLHKGIASALIGAPVPANGYIADAASAIHDIEKLALTDVVAQVTDKQSCGARRITADRRAAPT